MIRPIDLAQGFDSGYTKDFVNRRCINLFRSVANSPSLSDAQLLGAPGVSEFADVGESDCRGVFSTLNRLFAVYGTGLYEISESGAVTSRGTVNAASDGSNTPVKFATNGFQIAIITTETGYFYDLSANTLTEIGDAVFTDYLPILDVTYKDGHFFYLNDDSILQGSLVTDIDGANILPASATTSVTGWITNGAAVTSDGQTITATCTSALALVAGYTVSVSAGSTYTFSFAVTLTSSVPSIDVSIIGVSTPRAYATTSIPLSGSYTLTFTNTSETSVYIFFGTPSAPSGVGAYFYINSLNYTAAVGEGTQFNALDFGQAETNPDGNVAIHTSNNMVYVLGENTIESFQSVASDGFILQRIQGGTIQKGCVAANTVIDFMGGFTFLGRDSGETISLYMVVGSEYAKLSTPAIEYYIQTLTKDEISEATCWTYQSHDGGFLVLDIGNATFVYDHETSKKTQSKIWHERQSGSINWTSFSPFNGIYSANVFGKTIIGDKAGSLLGELSPDIYTEYDEKIPHGITTQPFDLDGVKFNELKASLNVGGEDFTTSYTPVYFEDVSVSDAYDASPSTVGVLTSSGRVFTVASVPAAVPDYYARSLKLADFGYNEAGFGFTLSTTNSYTCYLALSPFGSALTADFGNYFVGCLFAYSTGTGALTVTLYNHSDTNVNTESVVIAAYAGEELFLSVQQNGTTCTQNLYQGSQTIPIVTKGVGTAGAEGKLPAELYLNFRLASGTLADYFKLTIKKNPINPNNCVLLQVPTVDEVVTKTPLSLTYSQNIPLPSGGYSLVGNSDIDATATTHCYAWSEAFTHEYGKEYMIGINLDTTAFPAGKVQQFDLLLMADNTITQTGSQGDGVSFKFTYTESTGIMSVESRIDWLGTSTNQTATFPYTDEDIIYVSFFNSIFDNTIHSWVRANDQIYYLNYCTIAGLLSTELYMYLNIHAGTSFTPDQVSVATISIDTQDLIFEAEIIGETEIQENPEPSVELSYSIDGGRTFNTPVSRPLGTEGQYTKQVKWSRLGIIDQARVLRLFSDSKVKFAINKIEVDIDE